MEQPLLSSPVGDHEPRAPVWTGDYPEFEALVTGSEIRAAASQDPYPAWINAPILTPEHSLPPRQYAHGIESTVHNITHDEARELLVEHVNRHCCWGKKPAWTWNIEKMENCSAYIGTLETFIEERELHGHSVPYDGRQIDQGKAPGSWELDTREHFPPFYIPRKEVSLHLPHSQSVEPCKACLGHGEVACNVCTALDESGNLQQRKSFTCSKCNGRGLIAHMDGSDSRCNECKGSGKVYCASCHSRGLLKCNSCQSAGSFLHSNSVVVRWTTATSRKVIASCHAASVPDEVFQQAKGVQIYCNESQQCQGAEFQDSGMLSKFSQEIIAERAPIPPTARVISERHRITTVPVTRVVMGDGKNKYFRFYIIGLKKEVYLKHYPSMCCGCCCSIQ